MEYLKVGNIINTFGIRGELKIDSLTDFPQERFKAGKVLYILFNNRYEAVTVKSYRVHKGFVLLLLKDLENINFVEKYKGSDLYVSKNDLHKLKDGQYYFFQLVDCEVFYNDTLIGKVIDIDGGYQPVLRVKSDGKEVLIPYVDRFIKNVDLETKKINVDLIEGMLWK